jgi:hypothetical protein
MDCCFPGATRRHCLPFPWAAGILGSMVDACNRDLTPTNEQTLYAPRLVTSTHSVR